MGPREITGPRGTRNALMGTMGPREQWASREFHGALNGELMPLGKFTGPYWESTKGPQGITGPESESAGPLGNNVPTEQWAPEWGITGLGNVNFIPEQLGLTEHGP